MALPYETKVLRKVGRDLRELLKGNLEFVAQPYERKFCDKFVGIYVDGIEMIFL